MAEGFYQNNFPLTSQEEEEIKKRVERERPEVVKREKARLEEEKKRIAWERENLLPNENGVVSVCPTHGRYFHEYDFKKEKVMNREIKCPMCGHQGEIIGEFKLDIPEMSHEWEY